MAGFLGFATGAGSSFVGASAAPADGVVSMPSRRAAVSVTVLPTSTRFELLILYRDSLADSDVVIGSPLAALETLEPATSLH